MKDLNRVTVTGHVGADPEVRHAENGTVRTMFTVASNRRWTDAAGEAQEETEWFNVVCFARLAEIAGDYLNKGSHVLIEGRIHTRAYEDDSGQKRYWTEVIASELIMLDRRADRDDGTDEDAPATATTTARAAARHEESRAPSSTRTPERRRARQRAHPADVL